MFKFGIQNQMANLTSYLLLSLFLVSLAMGQESIPAMEHKKVVQANHYYSDTQTSVLYNVGNVEKNRSLIFVLRNKTTSDASLPIERNNINITLKQGSTKTECVFDTWDDLCVLKNVTDPSTMSIEIKCSKLPCDLSWTIFQPIPRQPTEKQSLEQLYELSDSQRHMIGIISCNDPSVTTFKTDVKIYTNNPFSSTFSNNVFYYLFNNEKKGWMFAEVGEASRRCATFSVYNVEYNINVTQKASIRDFVRNDSLSVFKLNEIPSTDFMIDAEMHELDKTQVIKSGLEIKVTGQTSGNRQTIEQYTIRPFAQKTQFPFKYILKKIDGKYKNIQVEFKSTGNVIMINFVLDPQNRQQVELGQISYFHLNKDEKILFKVPANSEAANDKKGYIYASNKQVLTLNSTQCNLRSGCEFQIKASDSIDASLYLGQGKQQNKEEVVIAQFKKEVTKKGRQSEIHYYKTPLVAKQAFQLVVNSPNVIIYTATEDHCLGQQPSKSCYQNVFNYHNPTIYEPEKNSTLILSVQVLDNCQYTLTRINENDEFIDLKDGQSFTYLMDDQEDKVMFKFKIDKKQPVSFNLISPLNSLYLLVQNGNKIPSTEDMNIASTDGYISFTKNQVKELSFTILIKKTQDHLKKFVHFTLIASTKQANLRLQPGIAHYQTLKSEDSRIFAFEFQPKEEYIVSFYTHNAKAKDKVNLEMMVSNKNQWTKIDPKHSFTIDRASDVLQLKDVSQELCSSEGAEECSIFIKIVNTMDSEVDLTLNLMVKNSIIQLKDGIWQSYAENAIAVSSNFYFYPKHANKSVQIMYRSVFTDLRISYAIWKADDKNIDPTEWPFPKTIKKDSKQNQVTLFKPIKHISIDSAALKQCWPSCVVLIALIKNSTQVKGQFENTYLENGQFSIMASNNYVEIPQKTKVDAVLKQNESKYFMIDLKYVLEKQDSALTLFTTSTIGYYELKGNLYSEKNPNCPSEDEQSQFRFGNLETQIKVSTIMKKLEENDMGEDRNVYLCLLAKAYTNTKLSFEYTSDQDSIKILQVDSFQTVTVDKTTTKLYQVSANQEYYIKFTRNKGFPFVSFAKCTEGGDYEECLDNLVSSKDKGKQIVSKTQSFSEDPCAKCIIFIKISAQEPAEVDIHLQSKYTQIQLKENKMISDFTNENQQNRYSILALRNEETIINIQITEGDVQAHITDFNNVNITKTNDKDKNLIHIVIPAQNQKQSAFDDKNLQILGAAWMTSFGLSNTFSYLHLTIKAKNGKGATAYTLTYSSGQRQTYLQDGLITDYVLEPQKETKFFYENTNGEGHGYLSISMQNSANLHNLNLKMFYIVDGGDEDSQVEILAQMPPMRKKTPNPTVLYSLPAQKLIVIKMKNPSEAEQKVSIGINHQEVVLLPFNHEFPFPLHKKETINFLIDVNNPGYLKLSIKKCDESEPEFSYTFDYDGFQKGEFTYSSEMNEDPKFEYYVKAKEIGTLYVNFRGEEDDDSLLSIRAEYSPQKIKSNNIKPGNKGILDYQLLDSTTAELTFTEVSCGTESSCHKQFDYFTISAKDQQELYSQTVCPTQYFATFQTVSTTPLPLNKIKANPDSNGKITFQYTLMDHISYVGVKGINAKTGEEIYYRPIEIVTIWGQISRTSTTHRFTLIGVSLCLFCVVLMWCRRNARKGYKPLEEDG